MKRRLVDFTIWCTVLIAAGLVLRLAGTALPPLGFNQLTRWPAWVQQHGALPSVFALVRLLTLAAWWYLAVTTAVGVALRLVRADGLMIMTNRLTMPLLRRFLATTVSGIVMVSGPSSLAWALEGSPTVDVAAAVVPPTRPDDLGAAAIPSLTMQWIPPESPESTTSESPATAVAETTDGQRQWTVKRGESFWSIAESHLETIQPGAIVEDEVARYWLRLVAANRGILDDPDNPDLIFPGQVFTLPAQ